MFFYSENKLRLSKNYFYLYFVRAIFYSSLCQIIAKSQVSSMFWESLQYSFGVTFPIIFLMFVGVFLRRRKFVDDAFCHTASKLVFNFTLPPMLFLNVIKSPLNFAQEINLILTGLVGTLIIYLWAEWWAARNIQTREYRCIFTQGTFRTNAAILGLALVINAYGDAGIAPVSLYTAFLVLIFNSLGVVTILNSLSNEKPNAMKLLQAVIKNPLILAIIVGMLFNYFEIRIPTPVMKSLQPLAQVTLPLALICIGASIDFKALYRLKSEDKAEQELNRVVLYSAAIRLVFAPIFLFALGKWIFQLSPIQLGIIFLTASAPVAAAVYAMTRAYGGNGTGAANLIGLTTIGSVISTNVGLFLLKQVGWI